MRNRKMLALLFVVVLIVSLMAAGCSEKDNTSLSADTSSRETSDRGSEEDGENGAEGDTEADAETTDPAGTAGQLGSLKSFSAGTLDGGSFTQEDIAAKDVTVINFWSLTCGPCIAEMPDLAAFAKALPENVQVITVCLDGAGNEDIAKNVLAEAGYEGVTLISGDGDLSALCGNLRYTPTTIMADSEGRLVGDAIIGGQKDLSGTFLEAVNASLRAAGKAEISLEE